MSDLILTSSFPYRRELPTCLRLLFESASPDIDESHRPGESAEELVRRLSVNKAEALAGRHPQHLMIGSNQAAALNGDILGKPHTPERVTQQSRDANGKNVTFLTRLALPNNTSRRTQVTCVPFTVYFRHLDESRIRRYVGTERPLGCTGSFKAEGLSVNLFRAIEGEDATSLMGLPLIRLANMLLGEGVGIP